MATLFDKTPFGSLSFLKREQRLPYVELVVALPTSVRNLVDDLKTGSFVRGVAKQARLPQDQEWRLSFAVLRVAVGEIEMAKLGATLSSELKLPNDKAQAIAKEIEKELFTPVMLELNDWLAKQKKTAASAKASASQSGTQNVIDLKNQS